MIVVPRSIEHEKREVTVRLALVPLFVGMCYIVDWWWLRGTTVSLLMQLSSILHLPMRRVAIDLVELGPVKIQFSVACTMVDAFFGAIPLLWLRGTSLLRNLLRLVSIFGGVFVLNVVRLEVGLVAIDRGVPWWLAHECVAGVAYFCIFLLIMRVSAWKRNEGNDAQQAHPTLAEATVS